MNIPCHRHTENRFNPTIAHHSFDALSPQSVVKYLTPRSEEVMRNDLEDELEASKREAEVRAPLASAKRSLQWRHVGDRTHTRLP